MEIGVSKSKKMGRKRWDDLVIPPLFCLLFSRPYSLSSFAERKFTPEGYLKRELKKDRMENIIRKWVEGGRRPERNPCFSSPPYSRDGWTSLCFGGGGAGERRLSCSVTQQKPHSRTNQSPKAPISSPPPPLKISFTKPPWFSVGGYSSLFVLDWLAGWLANAI